MCPLFIRSSSRITDNKNISSADEFYDNLVRRKLFKTWQRYVKRKLSSRKFMYKAKFFHAMRIKQKVFNALSKNVIRCKNSDIAIQKLKLFYKRLLIINVWNEWIKLIDEKNDLELKNNLSLATSFYKENIVRKCLKNLVLHKTTELKKKALKLKLDDFCKAYYCKKYLTEWKTAYKRKKRIIMLEEKVFIIISIHRLFINLISIILHDSFSFPIFLGCEILRCFINTERFFSMDRFL